MRRAELVFTTFVPRHLRFDEKLSLAHDLLLVDPDVELAADYVDMGGGIPVSAGVGAIGIAERNVHAGILLILKDLTDHILQIDVGSDGKFSDAIAIDVRMCVLPEVIFQFAVFRVSLSQA